MKAYGSIFVLTMLAASLAGCAGARYHREGLDALADGKLEDGLSKLELAVRAEPGNTGFRSDLLNRKTELIQRLLAEADNHRSSGKVDQAEVSYQRVLKIEPANSRAQAGLEALTRERRHLPLLDQARASLKQGDPERASAMLQVVLAENPAQADAIVLRRQAEELQARAQLNAPTLRTMHGKPISLEFKDASLKVVLEALARTTGIDFVLDKDVRPDLRTTVFLRRASLEDAVDLILQTNHLEKKVLNRNTILIYASTPDKLKEYQDLVVRGFYLANADVKQTQLMIKNMLKTKDTFVDEKVNLLVIRDTPEAIRLAEKLIAMQDLPEPEVMLDVEVLEVKRSRLTELGIQWPSQLTVAPLATTAATLSGLRDLNSGSLGITTPTAVINARRQLGDANILANPRIRARNREKAKIMIGDRVPVTNSTTTATGIISENIQYLDVGIKLEVEPNIYLQDDVAIKVGLEVSSLVREIRTPGGSLAYQIGSRSANTTLRLKDGETQILAGLISDEDRRDASRVPGIGELPILNRLFGSEKDDRQKTEIVLAITPRLVRNIVRPDASAGEFWSGTEATLRTRPFAVAAIAEERGAEAADGGAQEGARNSGGNLPPSQISLSLQGPAQAKVGATFKVAVRMRADGGVRSLPFQLSFDPSAVQVTEVVEGAYFKKNEQGSSMSSNIDPAAGKVFVSVVRSGNDGVRGDDVVAVLTVRPLASKTAEIRLLSASPIVVGEKQIVPALPAPFSLSISN